MKVEIIHASKIKIGDWLEDHNKQWRPVDFIGMSTIGGTTYRMGEYSERIMIPSNKDAFALVGRES